jgi:hypothetical protein
LLKRDFAGTQPAVVLWVAGEEEDLEIGFAGFVEQGFELFTAAFICVGEGVVEDDREAAVVVDGEELSHGEAQGEGDLLTGAVAE